MIWLIVTLAAAAATGGLWLGRRWGLASGQRRTEQALRAQQAELQRQHWALQQQAAKREAQLEEIDETEDAEQAAEVLGAMSGAWNRGH